MNYKNAGKCHKCPQRNDELGCPWWWEVVQTNDKTGQERIHKACGKSQDMLPMMLVEVIKASNRPAAELSAMRGELVQRVTDVAIATQNLALENAQKKLSAGDKDNGKD